MHENRCKIFTCDNVDKKLKIYIKYKYLEYIDVRLLVVSSKNI